MFNVFLWMAQYLHSSGHSAEAELYARRALRTSEALPEAEGVRTSTACNTLGMIHAALGRRDLALDLYRRAIEIDARTCGPDHPKS